MIRLFVGLALPPGIRARLAALAGGVPGARWVDPDNLHLTIRFIGEVDEGQAEDIDDALSSVRAPAFDLRLSGLDAFGNRRQARSIWAGIAACPELMALHEKVDRVLIGAGLAPDRRKFLPHVTLARLKGTPRDEAESFRARHAMFSAGPFPVDRFILFSSLLSKSGAIYRAEAEYALRPG